MMYRIRFLLKIALLILLTNSCKNKINDQSSFKEYFSGNKGWKSKRITKYLNSINYTATEVPLKYYLLKSLDGNLEKVDSIYKIHQKERIIEVEFQHIDRTDLLEKEYTNRKYEDAVKYMSFFIENDFKIITSSNDTIKCAGVNFERNFKIAPFKRILLHFNNIKPTDNIELVYNDNLFGNGIVKFDFNKTPIKL